MLDKENFSEKMQIAEKRGSLQDTYIATIISSISIYHAKRITFQQERLYDSCRYMI